MTGDWQQVSFTILKKKIIYICQIMDTLFNDRNGKYCLKWYA